METHGTSLEAARYRERWSFGVRTLLADADISSGSTGPTLDLATGRMAFHVREYGVA
jgi:hypothetical protein